MSDEYKDATPRSSQMPRDSCLLYPNKQPTGVDPPKYRGFLKLAPPGRAGGRFVVNRGVSEGGEPARKA